MKLRWLGTAGFRLQHQDGTLLVDPYVSRNAQARPSHVASIDSLGPADAVILSHGHFDHAADLPELAKRHPMPIHACPRSCRNLAFRGIPEPLLHPIEAGQLLEIGPFQILPFPIHHVRYGAGLVLRTLKRIGVTAPTYLPLLKDWPCGQPFAFRIIIDQISLMHMGTAGATPAELDRIAADRRDEVLLIALQGNDRIHEISAAIVDRLRPNRVIPQHHDDFYPPVSQEVPLPPFTDLVRQCQPHTLVTPLEVGQEIELSTRPP